jgi:hypothetical protein
MVSQSSSSSSSTARRTNSEALASLNSERRAHVRVKVKPLLREASPKAVLDDLDNALSRTIKVLFAAVCFVCFVCNLDFRVVSKNYNRRRLSAMDASVTL